MRKLLFLFTFLLGLSTIQSQNQEINLSGRVFLHDMEPSPQAELVLYVENQEIFIHTDDHGKFEITFVSQTTEETCGRLVGINCAGDANVTEICYGPNTDSLYTEITLCEIIVDCYVFIEAESLDNGQIRLTANYTDGGEWKFEWNTGDTTESLIVSPDSMATYCVRGISNGPNSCFGDACYTIGEREDCRVDIFELGLGAAQGGLLKLETHGGEVGSILWNTRETTSEIVIYEAGTYCVDVIFVDGCEASSCIDVYYEPPFDSCSAYIYAQYDDNENFDGLRVYSFNNGFPTYRWNNGDTTQVIFPDSSGTYCVILSYPGIDSCIIEVCYDHITDGACQLELHSDPFGLEVGIYASFRSSNPNVKYLWSNGSTEPWIFTFSSGEYCVTATDGVGCSVTACKEVTIDTTYEEICWIQLSEIEDSTGTMKGIQASSFNPNLTYTWSNGETGPIIYPNESGEYCVVASSGNCEIADCYYYIAGGDCTIDVVERYYGGQLYLYPIGYGTGEINYQWNTGDSTYFQLVTEAGEYCVTMVDQSDCQATWCGNVEPYNGAFCESYITIESDTFGATYYRVVAFGEAPFTYIWNNNLVGDSVMINEPGEYCVTVTDSKDCETSTCIYIHNDPDCSAWLDVKITDGGDSIFIASVLGNGPFTYIWTTGDTTETIPFHDSDICVTITDDTGCVAEACWYQRPEVNDFEIVIIVRSIDSLTDKFVESEIQVFEYDSDSNLIEIDVEIVTIGEFTAIGIRNRGSYLVRATAEGYFPTYYRSTLFWEDATFIHKGIEQDEPVYQINLISDPENNEGNGLVAGTVNATNNGARMDNSRSVDPIKGATILITDLEGNPLDYRYTDNNGFFNFNGLPLGSYILIMDFPGHDRIIRYVNLSTGREHVQNITFTLNSGTDNTTSTNDILGDDLLIIYPNPTSTILNLVFEASLGEKDIIIYDLNGRVIKSINKVVKDRIRIDLSGVDKTGYYYLQVKSAKGVISKKFVKLN